MADTFPYPNGSVVGILADPAAAETLRSDLDSAGFASAANGGAGGFGIGILKPSSTAPAFSRPPSSKKPRPPTTGQPSFLESGLMSTVLPRIERLPVACHGGLAPT